jgi:hypothetical protein
MKILDIPRSGSIAGTTSSHNRAGQYVRNRRAPIQPIGTGRRGFIRAAFGAASAAFASLTAPQQDSWTSFADDHPVTDTLGQSIKLTGHQMFVAIATQLLNVGGILPTLPPGVLTLPDVTPSTMAFSIATGLSIALFTGSAGDYVTVGLSKPMSSARRFTKTFWQPPGADGHPDAAAEPWTMTTAAYAGEFGTPISGQRVFARLTPVNNDGWYGSPIIISAIVTA